MKKYYLLSLLLLGPAFGSESLGELIKKLEETGEVRCEEMTQEELAQHCLREVCGPPGSKASNVTAKNIHKFLNPEQERELKAIEADVAVIYQQKKAQALKMISELEKRKKDPALKDTKGWDQLDYAQFFPFIWKFITWDIDSDKPLAQRSQMIIDETAPSELLPGIREVAKVFNRGVYNDPLYAYDVGILSDEELKEAVIEKAKKLKVELDKASVKFNLEEYTFELASLSTKDEIASHFQKLESLGNDNGIIIGNNEEYCQKDCQTSIHQFMKNLDIDDAITNLRSSLDYLDQKDKIAECKANFISVNQQNRLQKNFDKIWPEVKAAYQQNVLPRFSEHSQKIMKDYLDNDLHFYFDNPSYDQFPDLKEKMKEGQKQNGELAKKRSPEIMADLFNNYFDPDLNLIQTNLEICENTYPSLIWDSYIAKENILPMFSSSYLVPQKDNISVSPFTCEHHHEGSGILAHELGHAMSQLMAREGMSESSLRDYRNIRSCATAQWDVSGPSERGHHPQDKQFTEEDSADILSYMAVNDGRSLYACGFVDVDENEENYKNLEIDPYGSHSPSLVRLMRELSYKKDNLPPTCRSLMSKNQDKLGDKKCF